MSNWLRGSRVGSIAAAVCYLACSSEASKQDDGGNQAALGAAESMDRAPTSSTGTHGTKQSEVDVSPLFNCDDSNSRMFSESAPLRLNIKANFTALNDPSIPRTSQDSTLGDVEVTFVDEPERAPIQAQIAARGQSRYDRCGFRPFKLTKLKKAPGVAGSPFEGLGNSVKFITHCGDKAGDTVSLTCGGSSTSANPLHAESPEAYEQRVVMEHTVYQALDPLKSPTLKTRLAEINYYDVNPNGPKEPQRHFALILEPEDTMAKRCHTIAQDDLVKLGEDPRNYPRNEAAYLLLHLLNAFVIQYDFTNERNVISLYDDGSEAGRKQSLFAPYDFDLVGIFRPDYACLKDSQIAKERSIAETMEIFSEWLRLNQSPTLFAEIDRLLGSAAKMRSAINQPHLTPENQSLFEGWLETYLPALTSFRDNCMGHATDPSRPACYVGDDEGSQPKQLAPGGSTQTVLQPPTDVDTFEVPVLAGKRYSVGGYVTLEVVDSAGNTLVTSAQEGSASFLAPKDETLKLRASLGGELVASFLPWKASVVGDGSRCLFVTEDDYGNSLDQAARLEDELTGSFTPQCAIGDEDWFRVAADIGTSLEIALDPSHEGSVEIQPTTQGAQAIVQEYIGGGAPDFSYSFDTPGEYIVKLRSEFESRPYSIRLLR